jgi:hypothetical protein
MEISKDPHSVPNRGPELVAVNITFAVAAIIANMLRCYVRMSMVRAFGLDDWLMSLATVRIPSITRTYIRLTIASLRSSRIAPSPLLVFVSEPAATIMISPFKISPPREIAGGIATSSTAAQ